MWFGVEREKGNGFNNGVCIQWEREYPDWGELPSAQRHGILHDIEYLASIFF